MNWALSNLTGGNRVSRAILVRYSSVPLADAGDGSSTAPQTPTASTPRPSASHSSLSSTFAATFLHASSRHIPGRAVPRQNANGGAGGASSGGGASGGPGTGGPTAQLSLPLDVEETVTCFCRKARRKERDGDQNSTDTKLYLEESVLERKLPEADLKALVDLPAGLDYNEWLASHTLALFEHVNLVYGTISEFCTQSGCADMTGPGNRTYLWFDEKGKKTRVAAPQYIDYVMTFTQKTVSDESIFPTKYANEFPGSFESIARKILRLQFHVIAHLYAAHFREIALLGLHTHLNLTFAHLTALHRRFNLIDEKETDVLRDLEVALRLTDQDSGGGGQDTANTSTSSSALHDHDPQQQHQQQQQQHNHHSSSTSNSTSSAEALHVNSQSNNGSTSASVSAVSLIDGDAAAPPICTQPEAGAGCKPAGSSGLLGGILGDLTSGEFGDTTRYCTSAVPQQGGTVAGAGVGVGVGVVTSSESTAALNNGAGALHLNFSNNNNNNHNLNHLNHHHHHHHHGHGHGHGHHGHHPHHAAAQQQHSGLIQCNAAGGGGGSVAAGGATAAAAASSTTTA
ncbi:MOB kinase activator-like 2 isoform X2 [Drosophila bipectinata]|uniref:MOB kinase activator-like 2 isoform X2 n=1 Tax=Drosophila bipectinata TaxID=42026 RepID=UPI001C8A77D7|nr:MOB kinase activator-like 2 isoform X2 [Drosophila bipectinata]